MFCKKPKLDIRYSSTEESVSDITLHGRIKNNSLLQKQFHVKDDNMFVLNFMWK